VKLALPARVVRDRVSITVPLDAYEGLDAAQLDGPGCIRHIYLAVGSNPLRRAGALPPTMVIRVYFDEVEVPFVEAPVAEFFGVMHGADWYPVDNHFLSVKAWNGYNCYFPMPFAESARIELVNGPEAGPVYLQVDWHRYPGARLEEPSRFCARWRREMPTRRYGDDYLILDADGPGELLGFVYGVRLIDDADRWSHGGAENIYLDGEGREPAYIRGIGGEDTFGAGYGGALHPPETHHYAAMPYYTHEDTGAARPAQRLVGYRFFEPDPVPFEESIHMRFGCMENDITSTVYWYQHPPVRPFVSLPGWDDLVPGVEPTRDDSDVLPDSGSWWLCGPFDNDGSRAMDQVLPAEESSTRDGAYDGGHGPESLWLTDASRAAGLDQARWIRRLAYHGWVDFNHVFRPRARGAGVTHPGVAVARTCLTADHATTARLQVAWDDELVLRVNGAECGRRSHTALRSRSFDVSLKAGPNDVVLKLSNSKGSNHGGWAYAFQARSAAGGRLLPEAAP
jgi:Protein of unknown function (DUF2961)